MQRDGRAGSCWPPLCGLATVVCQAMIYATLQADPAVAQPAGAARTCCCCALFTGAAWLAAAVALADAERARIERGDRRGVRGRRRHGRQAGVLAAASTPRRPSATIESATGLGALGQVRELESPHTEENYLLREMGYAIARKHAARLRTIALAVGFIARWCCCWHRAGGRAAAGCCCPLAALSPLLGIYVERWLFFAEATHTVTLYYGRGDPGGSPGLTRGGTGGRARWARTLSGRG